MAEEQIEIRGVEELKDEISKALKYCPDEMSLAMRQVTNNWKRDVNKKFPRADYGADKRWGYSFARSWKTSYAVSYRGFTEFAEVTNSHRLFHLVENGHRLVLNGKDTGKFVPGKHYKDSVTQKYKEEYPEMMAKAAEEALTKAGV